MPVTSLADAPDTPFTRLLQWLDDGTDSRGERYLEMRRRLVAYFDRRNRPAPDILADETFDRVSRTLEETGSIQITPPARYCYVVARFVLLEDIRRGDRTVPYDDARPGRPAAPSTGAVAGLESASRALDCLRLCLASLAVPDRELIVEYYRDARRQKIDRRRALAEALGITANALSIRAFRLRARLDTCVAGCRNKL